MTTQEIVSKLWNLCNVLRDDGITYHQYVTELTYILFLKMAKETGIEDTFSTGVELTDTSRLSGKERETAEAENASKQIILGYSWDVLKHKSGIDLYNYYKDLLRVFGTYCRGRVQEIYSGSMTNIDEPKNLEKIITTIDGLDWYSAKEEGLGNLYEGLLEKNAGENGNDGLDHGDDHKIKQRDGVYAGSCLPHEDSTGLLYGWSVNQQTASTPCFLDSPHDRFVSQDACRDGRCNYYSTHRDKSQTF